jgi:hypothetical protein
VRRAVWILLGRPRQAPLDRILPDVVFELGILKWVSHSAINKTRLPDISFGFQILVQLKREAAFTSCMALSRVIPVGVRIR